MLNSRRPSVVWLFAIFCESLNVWLYYVTFVCGVMAISRRRPPPSSSAVVVVCCRRLSSSATSNNLARRPLGWSVCPLNALSSLPGADVWSPENLHHQPVGDLFQSWLMLSLARQGYLSPLSMCALQPYTACKLTAPPGNGFLQPGILKHDHEHVFYFPAKNCSRSSSTWYGSLFSNRTYCVVPRQNWAKLGGLTLSLSDFLLVLCRRILPDCFRALDIS